MTKTNKIIYWIATAWLALGMFSTGLQQLFSGNPEEGFTANLGYPAYFLTIIGVWKILGAIAVLVPRFPLIKEWAYAGFFFAMTGAAFSHVATSTADKMFPSLLLLALTIISWYFRPADRRVILANINK
ncbi:DoxX family protein [Chitinophaga arvensicola]|uniref:DoxX-like family protein n=1 Tax=Chitinophaga arvensicola TaxID=29529 RepID=A0A1I0RGS7_9BACT|nr:DoxX family protein [Chitinophaga arvensicola]SEW40075.1 DoxX-like family protein [Chitinophaga arvensicola]